MKWDNWKSPVDIISTQMRTEFDGEIMKAIQQVGVIVDKEELVRCMNYDRNQYENGYNQGREDAINEAIHHLDNSKANCHEYYIDGIDFAIGVLSNMAEQLKEQKALEGALKQSSNIDNIVYPHICRCDMDRNNVEVKIDNKPNPPMPKDYGETV